MTYLLQNPESFRGMTRKLIEPLAEFRPFLRMFLAVNARMALGNCF